MKIPPLQRACHQSLSTLMSFLPILDPQLHTDWRVNDDLLCPLFSQFGSIHSIYSLCKRRGFVMVSFYDIRHTNEAIKQLQGLLVQGRLLDIHSIPRKINSDIWVSNEELNAEFSRWNQRNPRDPQQKEPSIHRVLRRSRRTKRYDWAQWGHLIQQD